MRYLLISDVHANLEALEAVLAAADSRYDSVISLGDLVGYGPNPNEVVERVRALNPERSLLGNHDLAALGRINLAEFNPFARAAAEWTAAALSAENRSYLESLEPSALHDVADLYHASPRDPVWEYLEEPWQAAASIPLLQRPLGLVGHTHVPRVFVERAGRVSVTQSPEIPELHPGPDERVIANPGSVGQPRDLDPRAAYAFLEPETGAIRFHRVPYPVDVTGEKILAAGLPEILAARLPLGR